MEDIEAIGLEDCLAFYAEHDAPNNATLVLVGDVDTAEALAVIQRHYGHLEASERASRTPPPEPRQTAERRAEQTLPVATEKAVYAWHGPAATDPSHPAATLLAELLGGSESSRLHRRLVLELELCTEVSAWAVSQPEPVVATTATPPRPRKPPSPRAPPRAQRPPRVPASKAVMAAPFVGRLAGGSAL